MSADYIVPFVTQRDMEQRFRDYDEMLAMRAAFNRAEKCEVCGAKKTSTMRHGNEIVVTCKSCVGRKPSAQREEVNRSLELARARLAAVERLIGA